MSKIKSILSKWKGKNISMGGKATLVQSVLSAMPTYCLSFYKIPKKTIREIVKIQRNFLWGGSEDTYRIPWVSWDNICKTKEEGGLGIKNLGLFNKALLGKWVWRLVTEEERLWVRVIKSKYGVVGEIERRGGRRRRCLNWWRYLMRIYRGENGLGGMREQLTREVGNGENIYFWWDNWVGDCSLK